MLTNALLVSLVGIIATIDYNGPLFMIHRPLVIGSITGLVLGDFTQGLIIGATLELMWLGVVGIGGYTPPDTISGSIIGTALGIMSGEGLEASIALAVPISVITQQLDVFAKTVDIYFVKKADDDAFRGDFSKISRYHYLSLSVIVAFKVVPIFLAVLVGGNIVQSIFSYVPAFVLTGLNVAGGLLPAIGFAMLLNSMLKKKMWVFLLLGYALSAYLKLDTMGIALFGIVVVFLTFYNFDNNQDFSQEDKHSIDSSNFGNEDEVYDL